MTSIFSKLFTTAAKPVAVPAQDAVHESQHKSLPITSSTSTLGSRLRAAFAGWTSKAARNEPPPHPAPKALASRSVQAGWQAGAYPNGPRSGPAALAPSRPASKMTLEGAMTQLGANSVDLKPTPESRSPVLPLAFSLSAQRDQLPSGGQLGDLESESASATVSRHDGLYRELFSTLSDQASLDHEVRPRNLYPARAEPSTQDFDDIYEAFEDSEIDGGSTSATVAAHDALFAELTNDDGEGLSEDAARAVMERMSKGASREDALDALRDGQLGVPEYELHASSGTVGPWRAGLEADD